ncbi:hypothetical protein CDL15_Pgr028018 [Punica granatum]|nr:hypothetical protein CDL15_Pgr028018 [Punica granatum]
MWKRDADEHPAAPREHSADDSTEKLVDGACADDAGTPGAEREETGIREQEVGVKEEENERRESTCVSHGSISVMGRQRVMEDAVMVVPEAVTWGLSSYDFFAVYDGHGGSSVADLCRDRMHKLLSRETEECSPDRGGGGLVDWSKVMAACFQKMDEEVRLSGGDSQDIASVTEVDGRSSPEATVGCTAVVAVVGKEEIVVANCGDSRAVLCRGDDAVPLSRDHKPDRPDERNRIEAAGGSVINWNGSRVLGVLATSRSIGDRYLEPYVISVPEVTVNKRTEVDNFLVIASDGLWDVVSSEVACLVVKRCLEGRIRWRSERECSCNRAADGAAMLIELAIARGSKDNISVIVVDLKKSSSSSS